MATNSKKTLTKRERLLQKREQISAQLKALDAADRKQKRKEDTRRKIIIGAVVMAHMDHDQAFFQQVKSLIENHASTADKKFLAEYLGLNTAAFEKAAKGKIED